MIALGLPAANLQSPVLMHVEYRVKLADHQYAIGSKQKLVPFVIAGLNIKPNMLGHADAVTYSGPTYVAIHSGNFSVVNLIF